MISNKPYLLRAFHQWIVDSGCVPILVINANHPRCKIPQEYAEGGEIVFNVSDSAVRDLKISNELIEFKASFSGVIHLISAPVKAVLAIYAEENGEGIFFDAEEAESEGGTIENNAFEKLTPIKPIEAATLEQELNLPPRPTEKMKPFLKLVE